MRPDLGQTNQGGLFVAKADPLHSCLFLPVVAPVPSIMHQSGENDDFLKSWDVSCIHQDVFFKITPFRNDRPSYDVI